MSDDRVDGFAGGWVAARSGLGCEEALAESTEDAGYRRAFRAGWSAFYAEPEPDDETKLAELRSALAVAQTTIAFFASVIKSGEPWSPECETALRESIGKAFEGRSVEATVSHAALVTAVRRIIDIDDRRRAVVVQTALDDIEVGVAATVPIMAEYHQVMTVLRALVS